MTKFYVSDRWSDTTGHFIMRYSCGYSYRNYPTIQLNSPATDYKRSYEGNTTNPCHLYGFLVAHQVNLSGDIIVIEGYFGAYHGYDNTRANFAFAIVPSNYIDNDTDPSNKIIVAWTLSRFGWSNGSYGHYAYVKLKINSDNTVSIVESDPGDPGVGYKNPYDMIGMDVSVLFGYSDAWVADWNQWACAKKNSYIDLPTGVQYTLELADTVSVSDTITKTPEKSVTETLSLNEKTATKSITKHLADTASVTDAIYKTPAKTVADTVSISDKISKIPMKKLADTLSMYDSLAKSVVKKIVDSLLMSDTIYKLAFKCFSDQVIITDAVVREITKKIFDTINVSDTLHRGTAKTLTEKISLEEYMGWVYPYLDPHKPLDRLIAVLDMLDRTGYRLEYLLDDPYIIYLIRYMAKKGRGEI